MKSCDAVCFTTGVPLAGFAGNFRCFFVVAASGRIIQLHVLHTTTLVSARIFPLSHLQLP